MAGVATTPTTTEGYTNSIPLIRAFVYSEDGGLPFAARVETDSGWPQDFQTISTLEDPLAWLFLEINKSYGSDINLAVFCSTLPSSSLVPKHNFASCQFRRVSDDFNPAREVLGGWR